MKKVLLIIMTILLVVATILGYMVYKQKIEISKLKNDKNIFTQENGELKNKINELEEKIKNINQLINDKDKNAKYEIVTNLPDEIKFDETTEGHEIIEYNNEYYVIIKMGRHNSGGFDIKIKKVEINGNNVNIYVEEIYPGINEAVTMALTYPYAAVKFNFKPTVNIISNVAID